ncbi:MAG TPA: hypothetical protein VHQ87_05110, partial [Rhizobacter sp.]|nr:hypothetical protein [Rhizobacter sp.]
MQPVAPEVLYDQDFIVIYQGLDPALCRDVVSRFDADPGKKRGRIGGAGTAFYEDDAKISWDVEMRPEGVWQELFRRIHPPIQACLQHYLARSPILQSFDLQVTGYKIQMYPKHEGRFRWHADSLAENAASRVVAMVLYLNDVARGGETEFFHQGIKI